MKKSIHNLGKEARLNIIYTLLQNRSKKELAEELGITPAAITKYIKNKTHPSDEIIERCIEISNEEEYEAIINIIINYLTEAMLELITNINLELIHKNKNLEKLKNTLDEIYEKILSTSPSLV